MREKIRQLAEVIPGGMNSLRWVGSISVVIVSGYAIVNYAPPESASTGNILDTGVPNGRLQRTPDGNPTSITVTPILNISAIEPKSTYFPKGQATPTARIALRAPTQTPTVTPTIRPIGN